MSSTEAQSLDPERLREYWTWIAGALFLLITVDMLTTVYAARIHGLGAEANPLMRWLLKRGMFELVAVNLGATVLATVIFYGLLELIRETDGVMHWVMSRAFEVWLACLLSAGLFVLANNLTVIVHGRNLF